MLAGIDAAARAGFGALKIDTVVMRGVNDDELVPLLEYGRDASAPRCGSSSTWTSAARRTGRPSAVVSRREILARLEAHYGTDAADRRASSAPAERFRLPDGTTFGIIASTTEPFCAACDRSRLTADGVWLLCLYARAGIDLRRPLRAGRDAATSCSG